jgi:ribonuclease PH
MANNSLFLAQLFSACINGTTMALIDAGISLSGFVTSTTIAIMDKGATNGISMAVDGQQEDSQFILDPTANQASAARAMLTVAWDQRGRQVLSSYKLNYDKQMPTEPSNQEDYFWTASELGSKAAAKVLAFQRQTITQKILYEGSAGLPSTSASSTKASSK